MPKEIHATVTKDQFLGSYLNDLPGGGLFLQTDEFWGLGDVLLLRLHLIGLRDVIELLGKVAWHRRPRAWISSLPSGIGFQFQTIDGPKRDFLLKYAAGEVSDRRHSGPRHKSEFDSKLKIDDTWVSATIVNFGAGGATLVTEEKIERGAQLPCMVYLSDSDVPHECSVYVERVEKDKRLYVAGARFLRLPKGLRQVFDEIPVVPIEVEETRAQQIIKRSTFPPPAKPTPIPSKPTPIPFRVSTTPTADTQKTIPFIKN